MRRIVVLALVGISVFAAGCGSDGAPTEYNQSVEDFYLRGCRIGLEEVQFEQVDAVCQCAYNKISAEIPFEDFASLNDRLREDVEILANPEQDSVAPQALRIVSDCILSS